MNVLYSAFGHSRQGLRLLLMLLFATVFFVVVHVFHMIDREIMPLSVGWISDPAWSLGADMGFSEVFQYIQEMWLIGLLMFKSWRSRRGFYAAFGLLFGFLLLDDTLALHETWGAYLASAGDFPSVMGLRPEDLGELFVVVTYGLVLFPPLFLAYFRSTPKVRSHAHLFFIFFGLLLFCGVFLDILHMMVLDYTVLRASVSILEDAGEIVSLSLMVAFAFVLLDNEDGGLVLPFLPWQKKAMARSEVEPPKVLV